MGHLAAPGFRKPPLFLVIALLYAAASFIFIKRAASIIKSWEERYEDIAKFYESVKSEVQGGRCFPLDGSYYEILARGDVKVLCWAGNMRLSAVPAQDMDTLFGRFPYPRKGKDFVSVLKRHGVTHVTCAKASLDIIGREFEHKMDVIPTPSTSHMLYKIL